MVYTVNSIPESYSYDIRSTVSNMTEDDLCLILSKDKRFIFILAITCTKNIEYMNNIAKAIRSDQLRCEITNLSSWGIDTIEIPILVKDALEKINLLPELISEKIPFML